MNNEKDLQQDPNIDALTTAKPRTRMPRQTFISCFNNSSHASRIGDIGRGTFTMMYIPESICTTWSTVRLLRQDSSWYWGPNDSTFFTNVRSFYRWHNLATIFLVQPRPLSEARVENVSKDIIHFFSIEWGGEFGSQNTLCVSFRQMVFILFFDVRSQGETLLPWRDNSEAIPENCDMMKRKSFDSPRSSRVELPTTP
jgi:hypothetical protein